MNSILSISFSFLFLMQAMGPTLDLCCELAKLPVLFEHYEEYAEHNGTSFAEFIDFHYGDGQNAKGHHDDEHDKNLPFHGQHQCCHGYTYIAQPWGYAEMTPIHITTETRATRYSFSLCSEYSESPFQPPKA
ncbi:MAG: hypothetical protein RIG68_21020 [Imperialibacter sp.]|uniref:hypothetical protein n=1 Tax=Imperialibacter sp. TaxID=2038411 RepID=UPI0032EBCC2C